MREALVAVGVLAVAAGAAGIAFGWGGFLSGALLTVGCMILAFLGSGGAGGRSR